MRGKRFTHFTPLGPVRFWANGSGYTIGGAGFWGNAGLGILLMLAAVRLVPAADQGDKDAAIASAPDAAIRCAEAIGEERHHGVEGGTKLARQSEIQRIVRFTGDKTNHRLFDTALYDPDPEVASMAMAYIAVVRRRVGQDEMELIVRRIRTGSSFRSKSWAYLIAHSGLVTNTATAAAIVDHFMDDVRSPPPEAKQPPYHSYIAGEALVFNEWLRAIRYSEEQVMVPLLREKWQEELNEKVRKWLMIARAMAGDSQAIAPVRKIVEDTREDVSTRAETLRGFARAAGVEAIPLLEKYSKDTTPGPEPRYPPLSVVARGELATLARLSKAPKAQGADLRNNTPKK